jgi:hypothetical protein
LELFKWYSASVNTYQRGSNIHDDLFQFYAHLRRADTGRKATTDVGLESEAVPGLQGSRRLLNINPSGM